MERQVVLPAGAERVWAAIADPERLSAWFGARARIELRPGGVARFEWPDGTVRGAVVESVAPYRALVLRWLPFIEGPHGARTPRPPAILRLRLEEHAEGTLLRVTESLEARVRDPEMALHSPVGAP
jgi:uncharacterized protein YndB with AHSA1/START domain